MIGRATCRGAATIVNAIATGRGAAFGITLEVKAEVDIGEAAPRIEYSGDPEGRPLVEGCVSAVLARAVRREQLRSARVTSEIPPSRGLKSSSAVSNASVLAASRALGVEIGDMDVINLAIDQSIRAGVTLTGAFDDACACYFGGAVLTDNRQRRILQTSRLDHDLTVLAHVPDRQIKKHSLRDLDLSGIRPRVDEAFSLATKGEFLKALELNSRAYAAALDLSEEVASDAKRLGAAAAGITGTGPATIVLCRRADRERISKALVRHGGRILLAELNNECSRGLSPWP